MNKPDHARMAEEAALYELREWLQDEGHNPLSEYDEDGYLVIVTCRDFPEAGIFRDETVCEMELVGEQLVWTAAYPEDIDEA